jgi:hypothetical protein
MKVTKTSPDRFRVNTGCRNVTIYSEIVRKGKRHALPLSDEAKKKHTAAMETFQEKTKAWAEAVAEDPSTNKPRPRTPPKPRQKYRTVYGYHPEYQMTGGYYERVSEASLLKLAECCLSVVESAQRQKAIVEEVEAKMKKDGTLANMLTGKLTVQQLKNIHKKLAKAEKTEEATK